MRAGATISPNQLPGQVERVVLEEVIGLSQAGFHGDSEARILSWGMEILPSHATTEEVPRGVA
jgi:hypothetical protein